MKNLYLVTIAKHTLLLITLLLSSFFSQASVIFINELHYDNRGADTGEFVELAGTSGLNLLDWSLLFYNGSNGLVYKTIDIGNITLANTINGFGFYSFDISGIQNGASGGIGDGIALIDNHNQLQQFISYEGAFEAKNGTAQGTLSQNINISQSSSPLGMSLQLSGSGNSYRDFTWILANKTSGSYNISQNFIEQQSSPTVQVTEPNLTWLIFLAISLLLLTHNKAKQPFNHIV
jgi:hypothetical protein